MESLMMSKLNNVIVVLPQLKKKTIEQFERRIYNFIWQGKDHVRRSDAKISEFNGGLNLPCVFTAVNSFKISWFRRLFTVDTNWSHILNELLLKCSPSICVNQLLCLGDMGWVKISKKIKSSFWKTCFKSCVSPSLEFIKRNPETCLDLSVWDNSLLKHNNSVFLPRLFPTIKNKLTFVSDLVDPNTGQLFNLENFTLSKGEVNHEHFHRLATAVQSLLVSKNFNLRN